MADVSRAWGQADRAVFPAWFEWATSGLLNTLCQAGDANVL